MTPPFTAIWWPKWDTPMDANLMFRGKRLLGNHKTIRGLITGTLVGSLVFVWQKTQLHQAFGWLEITDYSVLPIYTGFLMAFGALTGDAIKSFIKRQIGVMSGRSWFPWDQIDWILGMLIGLLLVADMSIGQGLTLIALGLIMHLIAKVVGFFIKINQSVI